jgi:inner membrane protein
MIAGVAQTLARPWLRFSFGLVLLVLILFIDRWLFSEPHMLLATGIADETAHLSTMVILLLAFPLLRNIGFIAGCLVGSVMIDLDHIPLYLGSDILTEATNRPFTHGFLTMGFVLAIAMVAAKPWRSIGLGLVAGLAAHFLRDMATSTAGVPLLWPIANTGFLLPYPLYIAVLTAALLRTLTAPASVAGQEIRQGPGQ